MRWDSAAKGGPPGKSWGNYSINGYPNHMLFMNFQTRVSTPAAVCYADGNVIFRYGSGEVALIEATPEAYKLKGFFKPDYIGPEKCWSQPVVIPTYRPPPANGDRMS